MSPVCHILFFLPCSIFVVILPSLEHQLYTLVTCLSYSRHSIVCCLYIIHHSATFTSLSHQLNVFSLVCWDSSPLETVAGLLYFVTRLLSVECISVKSRPFSSYFVFSWLIEILSRLIFSSLHYQLKTSGSSVYPIHMILPSVNYISVVSYTSFLPSVRYIFPVSVMFSFWDVNTFPSPVICSLSSPNVIFWLSASLISPLL